MMCLLIFAHQVSASYPLVVAANRDEFYSRPTAASDFWAEHPHLLAGRDLLQGGTWMGVTSGGRFAAVTNFRDPSRSTPAPRSRGELPLDFLAGSQGPAEFLDDVANRAGDYAGFNLLVGDRSGLWYFTNSDIEASRPLAPGIYGLSNARLDTPWPKVELGKAKLRALLEDGEVTHTALARVVADRRVADPYRSVGQGPDTAMEHLLSAQFIVTGAYGTRSSTTMWITGRNQVSWSEKTFNTEGQLSGRQHREFRLHCA
ncbi:MAG: NRDE family protein [Halioglobus sp.]